MVASSSAEPHSSEVSVPDLKTGGRWFDPGLGKYISRVLMVVIAIVFIPLSLLKTALDMIQSINVNK